MKYLIIFLFGVCLFFTSCKSKKNTLKYDVFSCEDGIKTAIKDANEGKYRLISYGLIYRLESDGFGDFYKEYILKNYNIQYSSGGCVVTQSSKCYREKIEEFIYKKYGNDIFEISKSEAITEFRKTKEFIEEIKPKIDSGKVFYRLQKEPKLIIDGQEVVYTKYLGFADFKVDYFNAKNYCDISFIIEKDGTITDVKLQNAETFEPINNEELMKNIKKSPKWNPGIYLGEKVRSKISFDVPISLLSNYPH